MMFKLQSFIKSPFFRTIAIYTAGDALSKVIPFVLIPIVANHISATEFGLLTNFNLAVQLLSAICALNTYTTLTALYYQIEKSAVSEYFSNLFYLIIGAGMFSLIALLALQELGRHWLNLDLLWLNIALVTAITSSVVNLYTSLLRIENKPISFNAVQLSQSLITGATALVFVVLLNWGWEGRALSFALGPLTLMVFMLFNLKKQGILFSKPEKIRIFEFFKFGIPLLPHTLSFWFKSGVDKIIISAYVGLADNGIYSIALTLASLVGVFTGAFFNAYAPQFYSDLGMMAKVDEAASEQIKKKLVKITYLFTLVLLTVTIVSYFLLDALIPIFFKPEYHLALHYLPMIMLVIFFEGMYTIVSGFIFFKKKTNILGMITFSSSVMQMGATLMLVKHFGTIGAAFSAAIMSFLTFLAVFLYSEKLYNLPWTLRDHQRYKSRN